MKKLMMGFVVLVVIMVSTSAFAGGKWHHERHDRIGFRDAAIAAAVMPFAVIGGQFECQPRQRYYYERRAYRQAYERVWIEEQVENVWVPEQCFRDRHGRECWTEGHYELMVVVPGHWETRSVW